MNGAATASNGSISAALRARSSRRKSPTVALRRASTAPRPIEQCEGRAEEKQGRVAVLAAACGVACERIERMRIRRLLERSPLARKAERKNWKFLKSRTTTKSKSSPMTSSSTSPMLAKLLLTDLHARKNRAPKSLPKLGEPLECPPPPRLASDTGGDDSVSR